MQPLPVPPLAQTLERYLDTVRVLLDDQEYATTQAAVEEFAAGAGPDCQADLEELAAETAASGSSWLADPWLDGYLTTRGPLPLTSSVGFECRLPTTGQGLDRAAEILYRVAAVHLAHLRGELPAEVDARGTELDEGQRVIFAGGIRRPGEERDTITPGAEESARREIIVLHAERGFALRISDDAGQPLPVPALRTALERIVAAEPIDDIPFTAWSYLDRGSAARCEAEVLAPGSTAAATHERIAAAVFGFCLVDEAAEPAAHVREMTVGENRAWTGTPFTYQVSLADEFVGTHFEHSRADGATLGYLITAAQQVEVDATTSGGAAGAEAPEPAPLRWELPAEVAERLMGDRAEYRHQADRLRLHVVRVPLPRVEAKISRDAMAQLTMMCAQLRAFGSVGNTYESVDMRAFQAGRTEALRPVTREGVELVGALIEGTATVDQLRAALAAHRERVIRCKTGQAIDRHLLGLSLAAGRRGLDPAIFDDEGYRRLTTDILSTTSLGETDQIRRVGFAPTTPDGFGLYYAFHADADEFTVSHNDGRDADAPAFLDALSEGSNRLWSLAATAE